MLVSDCFKNFFGLRQNGCNQITPESNLFLDDTSGINLLSLANNGNGTFTNHEELIASKLNLSLEIIKNDIALSISSLGYMMQPNKDIKTIFCLKEPVSIISNTSFNGVRLKRTNPNHSLVVVEISNIHVYPATSGRLTLKIVNEGKVAFETSADVLADTPFTFNIPGQARKYTGSIDILVGGTASLYDTTINCSQDKKPCCLCYCDNNHREVLVYTVQSLNNGSILNNGSANGLIIDVSTYCDLSVFLCSNKDVIKMSLYYKLSYLILCELGTPNVLTTFNATDAEKNAKAEYWDIEYKKSIKSAVNVLALRTKGAVNDGCILCAPSKTIQRYSLK